MRRDGPNQDPPAKATARAIARGRSGRGLDSIRPYLHAQIEFKRLMTEPFKTVLVAPAKNK